MDFYIYGYNPASLIQSQEIVWERLRGILTDKVLRFNPYSVDDDTLLACVERARWKPFPALTQMVTYHFNDIRCVVDDYSYEAIFFRVGNDDQEHHLPVCRLIERVTHIATLQQIHVLVKDRPLTNIGMLGKMQGKTYFVSHALMAHDTRGKLMPAYRMVRLKGKCASQAETIRASMIASKISMLEEVLAHPYSPYYLLCSRNFGAVANFCV